MIDSTDLGLLGTSWASTGEPINKTQLLLEILAKIDSLNATVNTRVPKKGYISISPAEFTPSEDTQTYTKGFSLYGQGRFDTYIGCFMELL